MLSVLVVLLFKLQLFSRPFIGASQFWHDRHAGLYAVCSHFDPRVYQPLLFSEFAIPFPESLQHAAVKRQSEFLAGRIAAQQVLSRSGLAGRHPAAVLMGQDRCPVWPEQVLGSISHTTDKAIAVVALARRFDYLGVDIEQHLTVNSATEIASVIHTRSELDLLLQQGVPAHLATTLIFSAKESLFKALYPFVGQYFGFECGKVRRFSPVSNSLYLDFVHPLSGPLGLKKTYRCRYMLESDSVITMISGRLDCC